MPPSCIIADLDRSVSTLSVSGVSIYAGAARRAGQGQEIPGRHRGGGKGAAGNRPLPGGHPARRVRGRAAPVRDRPFSAGRASDHRRLDGLPRAGRARLCPRTAQPAGGPRPRRRPGQAAARRAPRRLAGQAVAYEPHQGSVEEAHLQSYLDEFVFRFNRRRSRNRGLVFYRLLGLAAGHDPVRYRNIVAGKRPRRSRRPASKARSSAEPGTAASRAAMEGHRPALLRLNGNPRSVLSGLG